MRVRLQQSLIKKVGACKHPLSCSYTAPSCVLPTRLHIQEVKTLFHLPIAVALHQKCTSLSLAQ